MDQRLSLFFLSDSYQRREDLVLRHIIMSLSDFDQLEQLGEGAYSLVFRVRRKTDRKIYALKKVRMHSLKDKEQANALNEVRILASLDHPNIVAYKEAFIDSVSGSLW